MEKKMDGDQAEDDVALDEASGEPCHLVLAFAVENTNMGPMPVAIGMAAVHGERIGELKSLSIGVPPADLGSAAGSSAQSAVRHFERESAYVSGARSAVGELNAFCTRNFGTSPLSVPLSCCASLVRDLEMVWRLFSIAGLEFDPKFVPLGFDRDTALYMAARMGMLPRGLKSPKDALQSFGCHEGFVSADGVGDEAKAMATLMIEVNRVVIGSMQCVDAQLAGGLH